MLGSMGVRAASCARKAIALCIAVGFVSSGSAAAQVQAPSGQKPARASLPDCKKLLEGARKLASASSQMLITVREQRRRAERMREALGADVADESIAFLAEQERQLESTLREADAIRCPSASGPNLPEAPR